MPTNFRCKFIEITLRHGCSLVNSLPNFTACFPKDNSERLLLNYTKKSHEVAKVNCFMHLHVLWNFDINILSLIENALLSRKKSFFFLKHRDYINLRKKIKDLHDWNHSRLWNISKQLLEMILGQDKIQQVISYQTFLKVWNCRWYIQKQPFRGVLMK